MRITLPKVKLVGYTKPYPCGSPKNMVYLSVKVSQGKLHDKHYTEYLCTEDLDVSANYLLESVKYPSVQEHITFSFLVLGCSRVCTHQLVRHRIASYTQESLRYSEGYLKDMIRYILDKYPELSSDKKSKIICDFIAKANKSELVEAADRAFVMYPDIDEDSMELMATSLLVSAEAYYRLLEKGLSRDVARRVLPQSIRTNILVTMNLRELVHVVCTRLRDKADWEIQHVVKEMARTASTVVSEVPYLINKTCGVSILDSL